MNSNLRLVTYKLCDLGRITYLSLRLAVKIKHEKERNMPSTESGTKEAINNSS